MNITRTIHTAVAVAVTTAGLAATPALAVPTAGSLSNGPAHPIAKWDHAAWKKCWAITYAQWREDGSSPNVSATAADLTCGEPPL